MWELEQLVHMLLSLFEFLLSLPNECAIFDLTGKTIRMERENMKKTPTKTTTTTISTAATIKWYLSKINIYQFQLYRLLPPPFNFFLYLRLLAAVATFFFTLFQFVVYTIVEIDEKY